MMKMRWPSNGKGRRRSIDQAKIVEKAVGPVAVAIEHSIIVRPLRVPRSEGSTALLIARDRLMNNCCWREGTSVGDGAGAEEGTDTHRE